MATCGASRNEGVLDPFCNMGMRRFYGDHDHHVTELRRHVNIHNGYAYALKKSLIVLGSGYAPQVRFMQRYASITHRKNGVVPVGNRGYPQDRPHPHPRTVAGESPARHGRSLGHCASGGPCESETRFSMNEKHRTDAIGRHPYVAGRWARRAAHCWQSLSGMRLGITGG